MQSEHVNPVGMRRAEAGARRVGAPVSAAGARGRAHPRVALSLPMSFRALAARPPVLWHGVTLDVSRGGVRFRSRQGVPSGEFLALEVALPGCGTYAARGRAVWTRAPGGDGYWVVGAEFLRSGGDADAALAEALLLAT
jgi:hypothetical protein